MVNFVSFHGTVTAINDFFVTANNEGEGCYKLLSVENQNREVVNFVVSPTTYFVNHAIVSVGDRVTAIMMAMHLFRLFTRLNTARSLL